MEYIRNNEQARSSSILNQMEMEMLTVEIRVRECLDEHWEEWFSGFKISHSEAQETILNGEVPDQAALYGVIARMRDLGLALLAVNLVEGDCAG